MKEGAQTVLKFMLVIFRAWHNIAKVRYTQEMQFVWNIPRIPIGSSGPITLLFLDCILCRVGSVDVELAIEEGLVELLLVLCRRLWSELQIRQAQLHRLRGVV